MGGNDEAPDAINWVPTVLRASMDFCYPIFEAFLI